MNSSKQVLVRYNTDHRETTPFSKEWRVLIDGVEKQCNSVTINCPSKTSKNLIENVGLKWHISCEASHIEFISDNHYSDDFHFQEIIIS